MARSGTQDPTEAHAELAREWNDTLNPLCAGMRAAVRTLTKTELAKMAEKPNFITALASFMDCVTQLQQIVPPKASPSKVKKSDTKASQAASTTKPKASKAKKARDQARDADGKTTPVKLENATGNDSPPPEGRLNDLAKGGVVFKETAFAEDSVRNAVFDDDEKVSPTTIVPIETRPIPKSPPLPSRTEDEPAESSTFVATDMKRKSLDDYSDHEPEAKKSKVTSPVDEKLGEITRLDGGQSSMLTE